MWRSRQRPGRSAAAWWALGAIIMLALAGVVAFALSRGSVSHKPARAGAALVTIDFGQPLNRFRPDAALGAGLDGHQQGETRQIYTRANERAMGSAGFKALSYRLRTELAVEAWHWNPHGRWSDSAHRQGYWTSSSHPGGKLVATYGYRLPRRGNTNDQANDNGYSRLDDGDPRSVWKSNPYLDPVYTHESERYHPQWVLVDLGRPRPVDALRLAWGQPYARALRAQYYVGRDALQFANDPTGYWRVFPRSSFRGHAGLQTLAVAHTPLRVRYVRVLLTASSHSAPPGANDPRDHLGFAVREVGVGTYRGGHFHDLVRHRPDHDQTVTYASSTDPWHRAGDIDPNVEQPSFQTVRHSGLTHGMPMLAPVPVLYGTPEDAPGELRYLRALGIPVRRLELGEEPDGQLITPEDYGVLYSEFARALHRVGRGVELGGPGYQTSIPDWVSWPVNRGSDVSWTRRFLHELARKGASGDLSFFSFEWYPFDNGCAAAAPQLAQAPGLLDRLLAAQTAAGLSPRVPKLITEYGYSAFATRDMVDLPGALLNVDIVERFLADGGSVAYSYGNEPDILISELSTCQTWGNLILFLADDAHVIKQPVASLWAARLLTREWLQAGSGLHTLYPVSGSPRNARGEQLVSAYAVRRPDGRVAVMALNKDPRRSWTLNVRTRQGSATTPLAGPLRVLRFSRAQYVWHAQGARGYARPDRPPAASLLPNASAVTLAPYSLTVLRTRP